jgi:hypothetical protein
MKKTVIRGERFCVDIDPSLKCTKDIKDCGLATLGITLAGISGLLSLGIIEQALRYPEHMKSLLFIASLEGLSGGTILSDDPFAVSCKATGCAGNEGKATVSYNK